MGKNERTCENNVFAHRNAALEDMTADVPLSTSDYYLLQWADLFSKDQFISRLTNYDNKTINKIYQNYREYRAAINNPDLKDFITMTEATEQKISQIVPFANDFYRLSLVNQEEKIKQLEHQIQQKSIELNIVWDGMMNAYLNIIMPVWQKAIKEHQISTLSAKEYAFEKELYQPIVTNRLYEHPYQFDNYFLQYLSMKNNDTDLVNYRKNRNEIIKQWALENQNQTLANTIDYWQILNKKQQQIKDELDASEKISNYSNEF